MSKYIRNGKFVGGFFSVPIPIDEIRSVRVVLDKNFAVGLGAMIAIDTYWAKAVGLETVTGHPYVSALATILTVAFYFEGSQVEIQTNTRDAAILQRGGWIRNCKRVLEARSALRGAPSFIERTLAFLGKVFEFLFVAMLLLGATIGAAEWLGTDTRPAKIMRTLIGIPSVLWFALLPIGLTIALESMFVDERETWRRDEAATWRLKGPFVFWFFAWGVASSWPLWNGHFATAFNYSLLSGISYALYLCTSFVLKKTFRI